jgi:AcrR family transcriptional regulator
VSPGASSDDGARERILSTAHDLFSRHGFPTVGVDRIVADAEVAKTSLYRHFGSKEQLVIAALVLREQLWTDEWLASEVERRGGPATARLLAIFDVFDGWFRRPGYEGCFFTNSLVEAHDRAPAIASASVEGLDGVRTFVRRLAEEAEVRDAEGFARQWQLLMWGAIIAAWAGDPEAARRAQDAGSLLLDRERLAS